MDYGKSMGAPSTNQASAPPVYQGNFAHPPPYSAQPQGYGFSQQYVPSVDQQLNQQHVQQHVSLESALQGSPVNDYFGLVTPLPEVTGRWQSGAADGPSS
ncbi:uncharacterized protein LOC129367546 isoform X3 [Poeciliopsis prolifica]|uniref:uncharacterized protein LOC129367546 isoform X3 n=1 Tax=Poeciliopsis prolifica TaxID=188132 RepID=UPI0024138567|nr:uncharacterized protein LOC129367546 isoform X3 [Poeciliopsis prolifica]